MSQPSRPRSRGTAERRRRDVKFDRPVPLERRSLMAPVVATFPLTASFTARGDPDELGPRDRHGLGEHDGGIRRHDGADHVGLGADADLLVRRRHRDDRGRARRRIRQRCLRDLARGRATTPTSARQPPGRDLSRRSGDRQGERLLRPQHGDQPDRSRQYHADHAGRQRAA